MTSNQKPSIGFGFSTPENPRIRIFSKCIRILAPQIKYEFYALSKASFFFNIILTDFSEYVDMTAMSGNVVLCGNVDPMQTIGLARFLKNISVHCVDAQHMLEQMMGLTEDEHVTFEALLSDTMAALNDTVSRMTLIYTLTDPKSDYNF